MEIGVSREYSQYYIDILSFEGVDDIYSLFHLARIGYRWHFDLLYLGTFTRKLLGWFFG
jgi:hypothetical protein